MMCAARATSELMDQAGSPVFAEFFAREVAGQVRRASLLVGSPELANDLVQEAFVRVYERWDAIDDPGPYLNRVVLNLCRDQARQRPRHLRMLSRLGSTSQSRESREILTDVLAGLPFNQRAAIVLRFWGGLTTNEIAVELSCSPGSVGPWIQRALDKLRKELA